MKWHKQIALAGALAMLGGCAGQAPLAGSGAAPPPAEAFRLSPGDKVKIATFGEETLTGDFEVSPAGTIAFPLIGEVKAAGLQTEELSKAIEAKLGEDRKRVVAGKGVSVRVDLGGGRIIKK